MGSPDIVAVDPVPVVIIPPGLLVSDHVPVAGKPFKATLPVVTAQVGWVITPIDGDEGCPIVKSLPLSALIRAGMLLTTRIRYPVPFVDPIGIFDEIVPAVVEVNVPILTGEEKLPLMSDN